MAIVLARMRRLIGGMGAPLIGMISGADDGVFELVSSMILSSLGVVGLGSGVALSGRRSPVPRASSPTNEGSNASSERQKSEQAVGETGS